MSMDDNFSDADEDGVDRDWDEIEEAMANDPHFFDPDDEGNGDGESGA